MQLPGVSVGAMSAPQAQAPQVDNPAAPLLGSLLRVTLTDGRVLLGRLHCVDWKQNVVLRDTELSRPPEVLEGETRAEAQKRYMGLVAIAAQHVVSYEVEAADESAAL